MGVFCRKHFFLKRLFRPTLQFDKFLFTTGADTHPRRFALTVRVVGESLKVQRVEVFENRGGGGSVGEHGGGGMNEC